MHASLYLSIHSGASVTYTAYCCMKRRLSKAVPGALSFFGNFGKPGDGFYFDLISSRLHPTKHPLFHNNQDLWLKLRSH